ncbi:MAG: hypothetical protein HQ581_09685, partial [Planctomycetes bacterium]|nr:hypothetical protein [Planctomycetota bacterium]
MNEVKMLYIKERARSAPGAHNSFFTMAFWTLPTAVSRSRHCREIVMKILLSATIAFTLHGAMGTIAAEGSETLYPSEEHRKRSPGHITYYIDPADGSDANSGVQRKSPWRTFRRINQMLLSSGDRVKVVSPGSFDQTLLLMGAGAEEAPVEVSFAPGRYDFHPGKAFRRNYQISNTNDDPEGGKAVGILLDGARHFRISGPGACLFYRGKMIEVCIDRCEDIMVSDLQFDYHRPTVSEFTVAAVGVGSVDLKIHKDSHYNIEDGQITWEGEGWSYKTGLAQELDLRTNEVWRR